MFSVLKFIYSFRKFQFLRVDSELLGAGEVSCAITLILGLSFLRDLGVCVAMFLNFAELGKISIWY